ncbi:MAG: DUF4838 domain-containing protein [Planctomycetota bacterium]
MRTRSRHMMVIALGAWLCVAGCEMPGTGDIPGRETFGGAQQQYVFFANGKPLCRLVLPAKPEPEEREAAELIRNTFRDMGGGEAAIVNDPAGAFDGVEIHVGPTEFAKGLVLLPKGMDLDGFAIRPHDAGHLVLLGGRPVSTFYAAAEFLERYAGALWVWPGEYGTVTPKTDRFEATVREQVSEPAFAARQYSGMGKAKMAYHRIHQTARELRSSFHHNVWTVLKEDMYATHPEYFSLVDGKRRQPTKDKSNWQACTTNPEVIRIFLEAAKRQFKERPWNRAFSVSQNDGYGFCECDKCRALDVPGQEGVSDRYFTFLNAVADGVRDEYPDKLIACFAYSQKGTASVPVHVKLRPNTLIYAVVPTLADHHKTIVEWSKAAPNLGAYFWLHGKAVPKFYPHRWAEYLRFLRRYNVREVYAEVYQDWDVRMASWALDGPRVWITSKLLWNPDANIDELMERFCRRFYGPAWEPMLRYYRQCEKAWGRREDPFDFGKKWKELEFESYNTADMDVMEDCINKATALAKEDATVTARLKALNTALTPVAGYVRQLDLSKVLSKEAIGSRADAGAVVAKVYQAEAAGQKLTREGRSLFGTMPNETETAIDDCFCRITQVLGADAPAFWENVKATKPELERFVAPQLLALSGKVENIAANSSFEVQAASTKEADEKLEWQALNAPGWGQWMQGGSPGNVGVAIGVARTGSKSLVISGVRSACGIYTQKAKPGERYRVSCWAKTSVQPKAGQDRAGGSMTLKWQTAEGKWVEGPPAVTAKLSPGASEWTRLQGVVTIPTGVGRLVILLLAEKQDAGEQTWFDDLCIEKLCEAPGRASAGK